MCCTVNGTGCDDRYCNSTMHSVIGVGVRTVFVVQSVVLGVMIYTVTVLGCDWEVQLMILRGVLCSQWYWV